MARASGLSVSTVQRVWRAFGLRPRRMQTFKLPTDPDCIAKVRDVVRLDMAPPGRALVLCVDEKSQNPAEINTVGAGNDLPVAGVDGKHKAHDFAALMVDF